MKNKKHKSPLFPIKETRQDCFGNSIPYEVESLRPHHAYVIAYKHCKNNPAFTCIMFVGFSSGSEGSCMIGEPVDCTIYSHGMSEPHRTCIRDIYWFKVLEEIPGYRQGIEPHHLGVF